MTGVITATPETDPILNRWADLGLTEREAMHLDAHWHHLVERATQGIQDHGRRYGIMVTLRNAEVARVQGLLNLIDKMPDRTTREIVRERVLGVATNPLVLRGDGTRTHLYPLPAKPALALAV